MRGESNERNHAQRRRPVCAAAPRLSQPPTAMLGFMKALLLAVCIAFLVLPAAAGPPIAKTKKVKPSKAKDMPETARHIWQVRCPSPPRAAHSLPPRHPLSAASAALQRL